MKLKNIILAGIAFGLAVLPSCNKDDDDDTENYFSGTLTFNQIPGFLAREAQVTMTPSGITDPSDDQIGYYWYTSWDTVKDTTRVPGGAGDGTATITVPYDLGEYTIYCIAYADGYYSSTAQTSFYVVSPEINTTITDQELLEGSNKFKDSRDKKTYYYHEYAGNKWMKNNLGYDGCGAPYFNSPVMDEIFGRQYSWNEAKTACPAGWHLPSDADFAKMASAIGEKTFSTDSTYTGVAGGMMVNAKFFDERMWEYWPQVNITNKAGFCALPIGYAISDGEGSYNWKGTNDYAVFWTSDEDGDNGVYRYIYVQQNDVMKGLGDKDTFMASVRCVRD